MVLPGMTTDHTTIFIGDHSFCQIFTMTCITGFRAVSKMIVDQNFDEAMEMVDRFGNAICHVILSLFVCHCLMLLGLGNDEKDRVLVAQWQSLLLSSLERHQLSEDILGGLFLLWDKIDSDASATQTLTYVIPELLRFLFNGCGDILSMCFSLLWRGLERTNMTVKLVQQSECLRNEKIKAPSDISDVIADNNPRDKIVDILKRLILYKVLTHNEKNNLTGNISDVDNSLHVEFDKFCQQRRWDRVLYRIRSVKQTFCELLLIADVENLMTWFASSGRIYAVTLMLGCYPGNFLSSPSNYLAKVIDKIPLGLSPFLYRHLVPAPHFSCEIETVMSIKAVGESSNGESVLMPISQQFLTDLSYLTDMSYLFDWIHKNQNDEVKIPHNSETVEQKMDAEESSLVMNWYFYRLWIMERFGQSSSAAAMCVIVLDTVERCEFSSAWNQEKYSIQKIMLQEMRNQLYHFCYLLYGCDLVNGGANDYVETSSVGLIPLHSTFAEWTTMSISSRLSSLITQCLQEMHRGEGKTSNMEESILTVIKTAILPLIRGPGRLFGSFVGANNFPRLVESFAALVRGMGFDESSLKHKLFMWESWIEKNNSSQMEVTLKGLYRCPFVDQCKFDICQDFKLRPNDFDQEVFLVAALVDNVSISNNDLKDKAISLILNIATDSLPTKHIEERVITDPAQLAHLVLQTCRAYNIITELGLSIMWKMLETIPLEFSSSTSIFSSDGLRMLQSELDLLQTGLSVCEILKIYCVYPPDFASLKLNQWKNDNSLFRLSILMPCCPNDIYERRKFTQFLLQGTGHFVNAIDWEFVGEDKAEQKSFERALVLHCCTFFLENSVVPVGKQNKLSTSHKKIAGSTLLTGINYVAGHVSDRILSAKSQAAEIANRKHVLDAIDRCAEQWTKLCDDMLTLINFLKALSSTRSLDVRYVHPSQEIVSCKWTGQVIFQGMLQCALASYPGGSSDYYSEKEFFLCLCSAVCNQNPSKRFSSEINNLSKIITQRLEMTAPDVLRIIMNRAQTCFNAATSCTLSLSDGKNENCMDSELQNAELLLCMVQNIFSLGSAPSYYSNCVLEEEFAAEINLLLTVKFIRHLHFVRLCHISAISRIDSDSENDSENDVNCDIDDSSGVEELDFVPCQLRLLGPVEVARRVLQKFPRAYRTEFVGIGFNFGDGFNSQRFDVADVNGSDDESSPNAYVPLTKLLFESSNKVHLEFLEEERVKIYPTTESLSNEDIEKSLSNDENISDEMNDALLQQYRRSQTSLGLPFSRIMLGIPAKNLDSGMSERELETCLFAEVSHC